MPMDFRHHSAIVLFSASLFFTAAFSLGINYGQIANNLPHPEAAFANTGVEFIVGLGNEDLARMRDPKQAQAWVKTNVQRYLPATNITCIAVGNEVLTFNDSTLSSNLLPAMESVHSALVSLNLDKQVTVTTAHNLGILEANPKQVSLDFVLFESGSGTVDPASGLHYDNMFYAQVDAAHSAVEKLGYKNVCLQISETGWPSKGDADEFGATPENARKYNGNLMKLIAEKKGTPMRPNSDLNIYVFALFNENEKPGPTSERNFGLFKPDGTPVYNLGFNTTGLIGTNTSSSAGSSGGTTSSGSSPAGTGTSSNGYLSITADDAVSILFQFLAYFFNLLSAMNDALFAR
ncbi:Glucan endo-1,3-beta-glucosidase 11 [Sesamum angolense]|uniref:Glucan endo-1,3-beta-glucosidase 11 n=1 Tax=Sesamum angolense TaxID=2727404 RepID=A0AAE1WVA1_9LAMI|nr:Glucan endo-1,3-beta-glucosidase 11 [Sesamum angolense]